MLYVYDERGSHIVLGVGERAQGGGQCASRARQGVASADEAAPTPLGKETPMQIDDRRLAESVLYTDFYQLTMAQLYYRAGLHERRAQFDHFYRRNPNYGAHQAGYAVNAGLAWLLDWMQSAHFGPEEIAYLRAQRSRSGAPLFAEDFLRWLAANGTFEALTLHAVPEGRVVHPHEPLTTVQGPIVPAQLLETALLNMLNYQTLVATKAARVRWAARGRLVLEFGLRRAQDTGANAATRAALIGGADFSSHVGMSRVLGTPPKGTHAHSMVQLFMALGMSELDAFRTYADVYPDDCLLLVDTIDTLESGLPNAIRVFEELRRRGHEPLGVRLDSGDLAHLSVQAAKMLDAAGFPHTAIVLSNDLDELVIWQILTQIREEAPRAGLDADTVIGRLAFGVGTRLVTSWGEPALGGVYKLVAVHDGDAWQPILKVSEVAEKTPIPGHKRLWRIYDRRGKATADLIALADEDPRAADPLTLHHTSDPAKWRTLTRADISEIEPLLVEVWREGERLDGAPDLETLRARRVADEERLHSGVRRLINPHVYHVSLTPRLWETKQRLIAAARAHSR